MHIVRAAIRRGGAGAPGGEPFLERRLGHADHARRDTPNAIVLLDVPGRVTVPPRRRGKHGIEPSALERGVVRPREPRRPAEEQAGRAFALHARDQRFHEMRRYVGEPEQPKSGGT